MGKRKKLRTVRGQPVAGGLDGRMHVLCEVTNTNGRPPDLPFSRLSRPVRASVRSPDGRVRLRFSYLFSNG
jgi:hypothetical protein